ncbi:uncharacterized protein LOC113510766 [Galleria mellonella]|uniref:Uncharacterized protein LOC113510766 n=1 Tax=Galleria mellonella TaxID=7137 RepID=A0A6J1WA85_GALME|nr:uncharacterized protein LOC113510766 [Galleria mellonella]XP_026750113.1 uncharacterized protein LOC113510766 [Galleria mellonella]
MEQTSSEVQPSGLLLTPQMAFAPEVNTDGELVETMPSLSPVQIQQEYYENLADCDWVNYEKTNRNYLLQNIAFALFGGPSSEGELEELHSNQSVHLEGYTSRQRERVMKVYNKISEQSKYSRNDEDIVMSVLLIVCAKPKPLKFYQIEPSNYWVDLHQRTDIDIWCTPVFRIRKCIPTTVGAKCCKVYIDDNGRVYHDWESYLINNTQPKCVLIVPENGEYNGTIIEGEKAFAVRLTVVPSPTLGLKARVLSSADTASTVASIGALGVLGVAAFTPVGPVVLASAAVASVATGVYGLVRSSLHLRDRSVHEQTISPTDAEARGSWLNIAASSVGLAAGAASNLLSRSAAAGTNLTKTGQALAVSVEVLRHANLVTGGAGVVNSLVYIILKYRKHGEKPTKLELFQFTAATLFFCNAVMSNRTAQNIIEEAQATTINNYRATLRSNRHRKIFDKLSAESRRVQGNIQGNTEVIRGIKNIVDKDQYFADVLRINKDVNEYKLRISMTADGNVNLNSQHKFHPSELANIAPEERTQLFSTLGPAVVDSANVPTRFMSSTTAIRPSIDGEEERNILVGIHPGEVLRIGSLLVRVSASGAENVALLLENLSQDVYANLMTVTFNMLSQLLPEEIAKLRLLSPDEDLIVQIVKFVFNYMKHERPLGDACRETDNGIFIVLKEFFQDGVVRQDTILILKNCLMEWIEEEIDKRRVLYPSKNQIICSICQGVRFA